MFKNILRDVDGISIYGIFSVCLFFAFFSGVLFWAFFLKKKYINTMSRLPLADEKSSTEDEQ